MALRLLEVGYKAPAVIEELVQADPYCEYRQLGVVDDDGFAARTGAMIAPGVAIGSGTATSCWAMRSPASRSSWLWRRRS